MAIPPMTIELGFISDETNPPQNPMGAGPGDAPPGNHSEVFGISIVKYQTLETVGLPFFLPPPAPGPGEGSGWVSESPDTPGPPPDVELVYGVKINGGTPVTINLGSYSAYFPLGDVFPPSIYQRRPETYFRVQVDGGGRQVMYASYGDDSPRRFFEMWKDGLRFSFLGLPDPIVQLRSPSGIITNRIVYMRGRAYGRFGVDLGELNEVGDWKMQIRFVEESDSLGANVQREVDPDIPPRPPPEPIGELWRALHTPLILRVCRGSEDIW